ncbi:MAG: hypothetical protein WKF46_02450 [Candidatus Limnocylindrales bacterium]
MTDASPAASGRQPEGSPATADHPLPQADLGPTVPDGRKVEQKAPAFAVMPGERISFSRAKPTPPEGMQPVDVPATPLVGGPASAEPAMPGTGALGMNGGAGHDGGSSCTSAQLRRFIKSRPYVPMHELRRRFELNGGADDVTAVQTPGGLVYLGLPGRESRFIADLVRQGDVGLELCHDPRVPMVMGVFAIRPLTRQ